jgi:hypothetical protein
MSNLVFKKAQKEKGLLRLALQGPSGAGKTMSAMRIATGLIGSEGRLAVIDTENGSAKLYSDRYEFDVLELAPPYNPERYIEAIEAAENAGYDCILVDSASHEWIGQGGILEIHDKMPGNSFTNWAKVNPRHTSFQDKVLRCKTHIILTLRSKTAYAQVEKGGKTVVEKLGLQSQMRDGFEYELTSVLQCQNEQVSRDKDRTGLFPLDLWFQATEDTGRQLAEWLNGGVDVVEAIRDEVSQAKAPQDLTSIYTQRQSYIDSHPRRDEILGWFTARKQELMAPADGDGEGEGE